MKKITLVIILISSVFWLNAQTPTKDYTGFKVEASEIAAPLITSTEGDTVIFISATDTALFQRGNLTANFIPKPTDKNSLVNSVFKDDGTIATIEQNSVQPFTSVASGAVDNTLYLKEGKVGILNIAPAQLLEIGRTTCVGGCADIDAYMRFTAQNTLGGTRSWDIGTSGTFGTTNTYNFIIKDAGMTNPALIIKYQTGLALFNTTAGTKQVEINSATGACLNLIHNDADGSPANAVAFDVSSTGDLTITPSGGDVSIVGRIKTTQISAALTDNTPTDSEIDTATGLTPSTAGAGWQCTIKDNDGSGLIYKIESDGTDWYYIALTKAL